VLDLFGLGEPWIEDALLTRSRRGGSQGLEHAVHRVLELLRVGEASML